MLGVIFPVYYGYSDPFTPKKMPFVYFSVNYIVTHPLNLRADAKASYTTKRKCMISRANSLKLQVCEIRTKVCPGQNFVPDKNGNGR